MLALLHTGVQMSNVQIMEIYLFDDFFHLPLVSTTPVVHLELRISQRICKKFKTALMVYSGAWGKLIHKKTTCQKSRGTVPLSFLYSKYLEIYL
jgi:hypothetical protein